MDPLRPDIAEAVTSRVLRAIDELRRESPRDQSFVLVFDELRGLVEAGGKRIRPVLLSWGYGVTAVGTDNLSALAGSPTVIDAGAALELVHLCALIHDDVMDGSPTRRGRQTPHIAFERAHRHHDWQGDARHFGISAAIMVGDLALVLADRLIEAAAASPKAWMAAFRQFTQMRIEVVVGQYLDLVEGHRRQADASTALQIAELKTAKYTVERPLLVGASLAGATGDQEAVLSAFGVPAGIAFQLRDDLLGAFGDERTTGKPVGIDFREGKQTYLVAMMRELGTPSQSGMAEKMLGMDELGDDDVDMLQEAFIDSGAVRAVEARIDELVGQAKSALENPVLPSEVAVALGALADRMAYRDS